MKKIVACIVALGAVLAMGGCVSADESKGEVDAGYDDIARIIVVDGVRCVVVTGYRSTAVSCDWD